MRVSSDATRRVATALWIGGVFLVTTCSAVMTVTVVPDEDAYISYVYSSTVVSGDGLTYHGIKVEGFTNLLMTLAVAFASFVTRLEPASAGALLSFSFTFVSFSFFFSILDRGLRDALGTTSARAVALGAVVCLSFNPYVTFWGFSGMENSLMSAVVLASLYAYLRERHGLFVVCVSLIPLVRFDGLLLALTLIGMPATTRVLEAAPRAWLARARAELPAVSRDLLLALAPFAISMVFRVVYYGDYVPNTSQVKFFMRALDVRLFEGVVYAWNAVWSTKSIFYVAAMLTLLAVGRFRRTRLDTMLATAIGIEFVRVIYVGGDVGWKPFFRFAHLTTILILLLYLLSNRSQRLALHAANVGLVFVLTSWLQAPSLVSQKTPYVHEFALGYTIETSESLRQARRWNEFGDRLWARLDDIATDFPEDVLAATGKYLRFISDETETIITSAAGKVVYYSGLRSIDVTGLADVEWRRASFARRLELAQASSHLVFHSNDDLCHLESFLDPHTEFRPAAAFYSHTAYPGLYVIVFSKPRARVDQPDEVGDRIRFTRHDADLGGERIAFYTDRWDGPQEIEDLHTATGCLQ